MVNVTPSRRPQTWLQRLATYDFAPQFSAKVRRLFYHPLGVLGVAAFVSLLCGLFLHSQGFILCGGILAVVVLGVVWPWLSLRGISGSIGFDRVRVSEGELAEAQLTLKNRLPWPVWGLAVRGGFGEGDREAVAGVSNAPRRRVALCRWNFRPTCRGVYPLNAPQLTTGFPFGLWDNRKNLTIEQPLIVWPQTYSVGPIPSVGGENLAEGNVSRNKVGTNGDVLGVRPYRRGDSPRRIHWAQSARHDRLIVCELQSNSRPVIQIVLDVDPQSHVGSGSNSSQEWAIRVVASFAKGWLEEGAQVGLIYGSHHIPAASGQSQITKILDALAGLNNENLSLAQVLDTPQCRGYRDGLQMIVTTNRTPCTSQQEHQRWVILEAEGFCEGITQPEETTAPKAWLMIDSPKSIPQLLKGNWSEAKHGS